MIKHSRNLEILKLDVNVVMLFPGQQVFLKGFNELLANRGHTKVPQDKP